MVLDGDHGQLTLRQPIALHVEPGKHGGKGGKRQSVGIFGFGVQHGGDKVRSFPARDGPHQFATGDKYAVDHAALDGHHPQLDGTGSRSWAVFNGFGHGRFETNPADESRGDGTGRIHTASTHIGHKDLFDQVAALIKNACIFQGTAGGKTQDIDQIHGREVAEPGVPDTNDCYISHERPFCILAVIFCEHTQAEESRCVAGALVREA